MHLVGPRIRFTFDGDLDERSQRTFGISQRSSPNVRRISLSVFTEGPKRGRMFGEDLWKMGANSKGSRRRMFDECSARTNEETTIIKKTY